MTDSSGGGRTRFFGVAVVVVLIAFFAVPASPGAAKAQLGFAPKLLHGRADAPKLSIVGAQRISARVNRPQLRTLFAEAGHRSDVVPNGVDSQPIVIAIPRDLRAKYGNCPASVANTLQNQINGPPPPSADNGNCVVLTETPPAMSAWAPHASVDGEDLRFEAVSESVVPAIVRKLVDAGAEVLHVSAERTSLEETFVRLVGKDRGL
jgi:hypothetical protein